MVMIGFRDIQGRPMGEGVTSILQSIIGASQKCSVIRNAKLDLFTLISLFAHSVGRVLSPPSLRLRW
jgi:hypothetical protein